MHMSSPTCKGITMFEQMTSRNVTSGCVRKTSLSCNSNRFSRLTKIILPDTMDAKLYSQHWLKSCQEIYHRLSPHDIYNDYLSKCHVIIELYDLEQSHRRCSMLRQNRSRFVHQTQWYIRLNVSLSHNYFLNYSHFW